MPETIIRKVDKYDGQLIYKDGNIIYDLGNYLGGGAAGSVYQGIGYPNEKHVAVKVLKPVGFKLLPSGQLKSCTVIHKGKSLNQEQIANRIHMVNENIWWLIHPTTKNLIAAYEDPLRSQLRELPLPKCVEIYGWFPFGEDLLSVDHEDKRNIGPMNINIGGNTYNIPLVAPKYLKWLRSRHKMCREITTMMRVAEHPNIVDLYEVLELIQDDKATLFLVLELVNGGELFDKIRAYKTGSSEEFARKYFTQLLSGIEYCHKMGVCHRDLKPENLLLSDLSDSAILKIADFGLSELVFHAEESNHDGDHSTSTTAVHNKTGGTYAQIATNLTHAKVSTAGGFTSPSPKLTLKRLKSVVGSPHYVAPEITTQDSTGYDGRPVDMWSAGVILYSLLTGSLPFEEEIRLCSRYKRFQKWVDTEYASMLSTGADLSFPVWFFPSSLSVSANSMIVSLLHHDPAQRLTAASALHHPWCQHDKHGLLLVQSSVKTLLNKDMPPPHPLLPSVLNKNNNSNNSSRSQSSDRDAAILTNVSLDDPMFLLATQVSGLLVSPGEVRGNKVHTTTTSTATIATTEVTVLPGPPSSPRHHAQRNNISGQDLSRIILQQQRDKEAAEKGRL